MAGNTMIQRLEMKVLIDNVAEGSLVGEWGLSIAGYGSQRSVCPECGLPEYRP